MRPEVNDEVINRVSKGINIPPKPELLTQVQEVMQQDDPSLIEVARLIAEDVGISAAVLKTINSPFFGLARTVVDIKQAVMFLGFEGIKSLLTGLLLRKAFESQQSCISFERFWDTAAEIGNVALFIGNRIKKVPVEPLYTLGLFHDSGIPIFAMKYQDYAEVLKRAEQPNSPLLVELEESQYQATHCVLGYYLSSSWGLPRNICQLVLRHHDLSYLDVPDDSEDEVCWAILKLAENLVNQHKQFRSSQDWPLIQEKVFACLEMDRDDYEDLVEDIEGVFAV